MKKWTLIALIGAAIVLIALSLISKTMGYVIVAAMAAVFVAYGLLWAYPSTGRDRRNNKGK